MRSGLYQKIFCWLLLNLVLLGLLVAAVIGGMLFRGSDGLLPTYLFSGNVENVFRTISAHCQYKPADQWAGILRQYGHGDALYYTVHSLEGAFGLAEMPPIPGTVSRAAARMPRLPFTLCPDPTIILPPATGAEAFDPPSWTGDDAQALEAGMAPSPRVLYMRAGEPARYWLARALYIPDGERRLRYVLLAASSRSFSGSGLFFDVRLILSILGGGLAVSCLWWWPFVRHISKPLQAMTLVSERLTRDTADVFLGLPPGRNICGVSAGRRDEIGRLGRSINAMAWHLYNTLLRQRRFISHMAHELNSPLARVQLGLAVMEERSEGETRERVRRIIREVEHLSVLTGDILHFLRTESEQQTLRLEKIPLRAFLENLIETETPDADVRLTVPRNADVTGSRSYLGRAVSNVLRNAYKYAGKESPIEITVFENGPEIRIEIGDRGPGVPEKDLPLLGKPFFRSTGKSPRGGSGLGLSIVKYCIDVCNGTVHFSNRDSSGFVVVITLPRTAA